MEMLALVVSPLQSDTLIGVLPASAGGERLHPVSETHAAVRSEPASTGGFTNHSRRPDAHTAPPLAAAN